MPNGDTVFVYMWEKIKHSHRDVMERKEILTKDLVKKKSSLARWNVIAIVTEVNEGITNMGVWTEASPHHKVIIIV